MNNSYLQHHGILGQKWGDRNGPPYPLGGGDYSVSETRAIYNVRKKKKNSIYNKRHFDEVLEKGTVLSTLSYNKDRTKNTDMFYATHKKGDKHLYNALFNRRVPQAMYDTAGNEIGTGRFLKYKINNKAASNIKVASEDSAAKVFENLYSKDRDFYNFVTDPKRMREHFVKEKYGFQGYKEAKDVIEQMDAGKKPTDDELQKVYRIFNYVIPSDGQGDSRMAKDVATQRAKFFAALKEQGYGAVLDTNDAIYGRFKAQSPVIVFDQEQIIPDEIKRTTTTSRIASELITVGRKALGM